MSSLSLGEAAQLYSTLHHFFEVAVHTVLYYRRLYPERAFAKAIAFDVPVHQSRHPAVCAWIRAAVEQVMVQIAGGVTEQGNPDEQPAEGVNAVAVVVHAPYTTGIEEENGSNLPAGAVLERWVFDVRHLPRAWPGGIEALRRTQADRSKRGRDERDGGENDGEQRRRQARRRRRSPNKVTAEGDNGDENSQGEARYNYYDEEEELANAESEAELDDEDEGNGRRDAQMDHYTEEDPITASVNWTDLKDQLRGVLQRLAQAGQQVAALPNGCTFTVAIELGNDDTNDTGTRRKMDINWVPETAVLKQQSFGAGKAAAATTSIRSVDSAPLYLECWVEESAVKEAAAKGAIQAQLAAAAADSTAGDILPPPHAVMSSTATTASSKDGNTPQTNKGKNVSFS
ncbi:hypothetical protein SEUCBS139899_002363 [Sporothrix eucalyptigena]